jgi:hypothetical protein
MNAQVSSMLDYDAKTGRQAGGWSNKLIWGDNKLVLASLKNGPMRHEIEKADGLKLVIYSLQRKAATTEQRLTVAVRSLR